MSSQHKNLNFTEQPSQDQVLEGFKAWALANDDPYSDWNLERRTARVLMDEYWTFRYRVASLEEQLETTRELTRRAEERCAEATERLRVAHSYLLEEANGEMDEGWYYEALRATDITASFPATCPHCGHDAHTPRYCVMHDCACGEPSPAKRPSDG